jgi:recombination protein RecA
LIDKSGAWYSYQGQKIGQGKENVREFLKENPQIASEVAAKIRTLGGGGLQEVPLHEREEDLELLEE